MKDFFKSRVVQYLIGSALMFIIYKGFGFEYMCVIGLGLILGEFTYLDYKQDNK